MYTPLSIFLYIFHLIFVLVTLILQIIFLLIHYYYQIRELKLSKDNWNEYNILLAEGTEEEVQAFLKDCFDNVFEDFEHITDTEIVDRPNYVGTDFWIEEIRIEELMTDMEKNLIRKLKRKYK